MTGLLPDTLRFITAEQPLSELSRAYLQAMLARERHQAADLIYEALDQGTTISDIYLHVFQPVQYEVGWLWQTGAISVGHEHYATNATQLVMASLYPRLFSGSRQGPRLVAAAAEGELHEVGLRMITDFFEMDGWNTVFLGANTPRAAVVEAVRDTGASVLALGVTMHYYLLEAQKVIEAVRANPTTADTCVLVGGYTFLQTRGLWQKIGADATASDARQAIATARALTGQEASHFQ